MKKLLVISLLICAATADADPLADFQLIVKRCKEAYAARPTAVVSFAEKKGAWGKYFTQTYGVTYDVRKTDSLVSPLTAHIEIAQGYGAGFAATEDDARVISIDLTDLREQFVNRFRFAFRDDSWQLIDGRISMASRKAKGEPFIEYLSHAQSRDYLLKLPKTEPASACLGESAM